MSILEVTVFLCVYVYVGSELIEHIKVKYDNYTKNEMMELLLGIYCFKDLTLHTKQ